MSHARYIVVMLSLASFRDGKVIEHVALEASMPQYGKSEFIWIEVLDRERHIEREGLTQPPGRRVPGARSSPEPRVA